MGKEREMYKVERQKRRKHRDIPVKGHRKSNRFTPADTTWYITSDERKKLTRRQGERKNDDNDNDRDGGAYSSSIGRVRIGPSAHWG
jgi:hypothetical protein